MIPFLENLDKSKRALIAGCGGGFDVFVGVPIAQQLLAAGKEVVFANYSFTNLWLCGGERVDPIAWRIDKQSNEIPYFPEKWLAEWLVRRGQPSPIYAFAKSGVKPLTEAYKLIVGRHSIDLILLVDGGTDSILFGDEPGLGTATEDAISTVAACGATEGQVLLAAIGFGIDHHHGVSHHAFLENVAQLIRESGFLGAFSVSASSDEGAAFLDLVDYANRRQPQHQSIVCNSIASAMRGEFGDYHATNRTSGSKLFVNPLMAEYWTFDARKVVRNMAYAAELVKTERIEEARTIIERWREALELRPRRPLPL
jgi:hypothetical protein